MLVGSILWPNMSFYRVQARTTFPPPDPETLSVDPRVLLAALLALGVVVVALRSRRWHPDLLWVAIAVPVARYALSHHATIVQSRHTHFEPGLYLVLGGCVLLGISGLFAYALRLRLRPSASPGESVTSSTAAEPGRE